MGLPTLIGCAKYQKILDVSLCELCEQNHDSVLHALWSCGVAQDVWAGSLSTIQKCKTDQVDMLGLLEYLMARLSLEELEFFFV